MQIQQYVRILREGWWIVFASVLIFTGLGILFSYSQTPIYEATATFLVNPTARISETYDLLYSMDTLASRTSLATTYSNILESRSILESAVQSLGISLDALQEYTINSVVLPDSNVLMLQVQGPSPELAADLANAIGTSGVEFVGGVQAIYELRQLDTAEVELEPISPNHLVNIALSMIVGLSGGMAFLILREILSQAFRGEEAASARPSSAGHSERGQLPSTSPLDLLQ